MKLMLAAASIPRETPESLDQDLGVLAPLNYADIEDHQKDLTRTYVSLEAPVVRVCAGSLVFGPCLA